MEEKQVLEILQEIFRDIFDDEELILTREMNANDIEEWDSLNQINIIVAVEEKLNIKFDLNEIESFDNVGDMIDTIMSKIN